MPARIKQILTILTLIALCLNPVGALAATGAAQIKQFKSEGHRKVLQAEGLIDAPIGTVWNQLINYGNLKNVLPGYYRSSVLQDSGTVKIVDFGVAGSGLLPALRYQVKIREDKANHTLYIQRISGDFSEITASYKLISLSSGAQTRLVYQLALDMGPHFPIPGEEVLLKSNTEKALQAMQTYCNRTYSRAITAEASR